MDGAYLGSGDVALHKAQTSARFPFPTRGIEQLAYGKDLKGGTVPGLALVPGIIAFAGGLPIMTEDKVQIGAVGVSGGTADQDETCAQAGIEAAKDALRSFGTIVELSTVISAVAGMFSSKRKMSASNIWISMSNSRGRRGRHHGA
jgi:hypothetical protein